MSIRDKEVITFGEAMFHLNRCFNTETYRKLQDAILKEIENAKQNAVAISNNA